MAVVDNLPVPVNEKERLNALHKYEILNSLSEDEFDRITEIASLICDVPISLVSLIDENRQWFKSKIGLDVEETPREFAFCQYAIMDPDIFEVEDATLDNRFRENPLVTSDPNIRFYAGYPLIDPNGFALGTLCVIDRKPRILTTKQKRALKLLSLEVMALITERRQKEELRNFETLFKLSDDLIFVGNQQGYFQRVNPAFFTVFGWDEEYLLTTSVFEFMHPNDVESTKIQLEKLESGQNTVNFISRFRAKNNEYKYIQWTSTPEPATNNIFGIGRDITEERLKEQRLAISEERLRVFFENSQGLMCTHDLRGNFLSVNAAGALILGYTKEEIVKKSLFDIVPKVRHQFLENYLAEIENNGSAKGQMVTRHKDGSYLIWMFNNVLEKNPDGEDYVIGNAIDITEKYHLEDDLKNTKQMLEQTNLIARVGGWEYNVKRKKFSWTSVTKEIHGVNPDFEPDPKSWLSFYGEGENRDKIAEAFRLALIEGKSWDIELQITSLTGTKLWVRSLGNAEFDNGRCIRAYGTFQDIDEKKKAEIEVIKSKKLLDDVLQASSEVSIIATDVNGLITVFNTGAERLLGYAAGEMIGKQTPAILHPAEENLSRSKALSKEYGYQVTGFEIFSLKSSLDGAEQGEWTYVKKDGSTCIVSLVVTAIKGLDNNIVGYLGIATDITEKKRVEEAFMSEKARLAAFVEHAPAAVAMLDKNKCYIAVSNRWLEDYNLQSKNIIGRSHFDVFPNITSERKERFNNSLMGSIEKEEEELYKIPGNDTEKYRSWEIRPWYQFDGQIGGIMIFTRDMTANVKQREELNLARLQAEHASVAKSEFLANMSHEIRTPLNGVIGFTDLVLKTKLNDTQQQYLSIVNQSANALLSIINDILDFSKIEAGKLDLEIEKCDLYEIGEQSIDIITYQVQAKGLEMLLFIAPELPKLIWADSVRLKQILVNLLGNAAKFTEAGEIELKIEMLGTRSDLTSMRFSVRDTGIGIEPEKQEKIFEAFSQADASTTKRYGGTGLGLTISNKLLGLMGSKLELKSEIGQGSLFYFDLTLKTEAGELQHYENLDSIKRVLVVDDNENNRLILNSMMNLKNIVTVEARNGFEALQILAKGEQFDVIIMDNHMPFMDGIETIRKIRQSFNPDANEQPVILLYSSSDDDKVVKACKDLKVNQRLVKPVKMQNVFNALSGIGKTDSIQISKPEVKPLDIRDEEFTIVIAEDNEINMLLATTIVHNIAPNTVILEAKNGLEAVVYCERKLPDLILMDIQMPEMNGYEATKKIREMTKGKHLPIIALTAANIKGEREKCLAAGMDDFVVKPFVEETLSVVFDKWLNTYRKSHVTPAVEVVAENSIHFDIKTIKTYTDDNEFLIEKILQLTRNEMNKTAIAFKRQLAENDLKGLKQAGHKLYGTAVTSGLPVLAKIARQIEHLEQFDVKTVSELISQAENEMDLIFDIFDKR